MRKLYILFCAFCCAFPLYSYSVSESSDDRLQELTSIFYRLEILTEQQKQSIKSLQEENNRQGLIITSLEEQSMIKENTLMKQNEVLEKQKTLSEEARKYWKKQTLTTSVITGFLMFLAGFFTSFFFIGVLG